MNVLSLKPLPYRDPARVAFVLGWDLDDDEMRFNLRQADFLDLQRQATSFESMAGYTYLSANLTGGDMPERVQAYRVTPNTFALLGVPAAIGRVFDAASAGRKADVAVISHGLWQRRFGGDPSIVGRRIVVNGEPHEIVGVMPPRFEYPVFNFKGDLWMPSRMRDAGRGQVGAADSATVVGRLRAGRLLRAGAIGARRPDAAGSPRAHPDTNRGLGARVIEMGRLDDEQAGPAIPIMLVTVAMVLVLACANVANLLLARGVVASPRARRPGRHRRKPPAHRPPAADRRRAAGARRRSGGRAPRATLALRGAARVAAGMLLATQPNVDEIGIDATTLGYTLDRSRSRRA